jgi:hypothetical protein
MAPIPYLGSKDGEDALGVNEAGVAEVVKAAGGEDLRASLEPDSLTEVGAVAGKELGEDAPQSTKHGPPGVDDLKLTVPAGPVKLDQQTESGGACLQVERLAGIALSKQTLNSFSRVDYQ